jgi:phospholipase/carboxylesterase
MPAWFDVNSLSDLKDEDIKGMHDSQLKIEALIAQQIDQGIQKDHIFLGGFSQGAVMALLTGLQYEQPLAGIIALSGYLPVTPTFKTYTSTDQKTLSIFLGHGTLDDIVPIALANEALNRLKPLGYSVEYHSYEMAHQISLQEIQDIRQWLIKTVS